MPFYESTKIGLNIRKARMLKSAQVGFGYTRKMLADAMEEQPHIIAVLESGKYYPDYEHIKKIAEICDVSIKFLVGEDFQDADNYIEAIRNATKDTHPSQTAKIKCKDEDPY